LFAYSLLTPQVAAIDSILKIEAGNLQDVVGTDGIESPEAGPAVGLFLFSISLLPAPTLLLLVLGAHAIFDVLIASNGAPVMPPQFSRRSSNSSPIRRVFDSLPLQLPSS
jgi:hypothetical protein